MAPALRGNLPTPDRLAFLMKASPAVVYSDQPLPGYPTNYISENVERLLGYASADVCSPGWFEAHLHPDDVQAMADDLQQVVRRDSVVHEYRLRHRDGSYRWIRDETHLIRSDDGEPVEIVGSLVDVTAAKLVEEELRASETRFSELLDHLDVGLWLLDPIEDRIEYVSPGYERMFGIGLGDLQAEQWAWLASVHPDDRNGVQARIAADPAHAEVEYRYRGPDGHWRWAHGRTFAMVDEGGSLRHVAGLLVDVTDRRQAEEELRESELRFRQLAENIDKVFWLVDMAGRLLYVSPAYSHVWGRDVAELDSDPKSYQEAVHPEDRERVAAQAGDAQGIDLTYRIVRPDGSIAWIHDRSFPVRDELGTVIRLAGIATDITAHLDEMIERNRLNEELAGEVRDRAAMAESLARLAPGATAEATAAAICREVRTLPDVDGASVVILEPGRRIVPLAVEAPAGAPVRVGRPLPVERAAYLSGRAAQGLWVESFQARPEDGSYGRRWVDAGVKSAAYVPLVVDGEPAGLLIATSVASPERLSARVTALAEYAAVAAGLLAPELQLRLRNGELRAAIRRTIDERAFETVFQPVVELAGGAIVGFEALSRFNDGQSPETVFGAAEAAGLGLELEVATIRSALSAVRQLSPGAWLSINVSPALATRRGLVGGLLSQVERQVVIEITERTAITDYAAVRRAINTVAGDVRLAVDDAGAGFASLRHVVELRPQYVKLDRGLVSGIDEDPARQAMVAGMVYFANETGCGLIAEGVESEGERRTLRRLGVPFGQGYLLGRPAPADTWMLGRRARTSSAYSRTTTSPEAKVPVT